jgi:hypothetical protein
MSGKVIRIANGQGFWGDSVDAPVALVERGGIDYLTLDYLAEVTMSIMQRQKRKDPQTGYATDFVELMRRILRACKEKKIRVVANAGGVNPAACRERVLEVARGLGIGNVKIATVEGDDILPHLDELIAGGAALASMDTGRPLAEVRARVLSANAYISTFALAEALDTGADVVITGRCTDPGLTLAPMIHEFGWKENAWDLLAAGTVAGHIIECGAQVTGGNYTRWWEVDRLEAAGYPVVEATADGGFVITKQDGTGGLVNVPSVTEQILYEMGDPSRYISADVVIDFRTIRLAQEGANRVRVSGIKGSPATDTFKVSISYLNGWKASGQLTISGPHALEKARRCAEIVWSRLAAAGAVCEETSTEMLGVDSCHGPIAPRAAAPGEVVLRLGAKDQDRAKVDRFGKELAPLITAGPPGVTGFAGGRPKPQEIVAYWPALIPKSLIRTSVRVEET